MSKLQTSRFVLEVCNFFQHGLYGELQSPEVCTWSDGLNKLHT